MLEYRTVEQQGLKLRDGKKTVQGLLYIALYRPGQLKTGTLQYPVPTSDRPLPLFLLPVIDKDVIRAHDLVRTAKQCILSNDRWVIFDFNHFLTLHKT